MKIVKLTTAWKHSFLASQLDQSLVDFKFEIDNDCDECDYWIIWGDLPLGSEKMIVRCAKDNIYYITDEVHENKHFIPSFLNQFAKILTCRDDIFFKNIVKTHEINHWQLNKSIDNVNNNLTIEKSKTISVVCSDLTFLFGHKKRFSFVNKLIGHFKDKLDVYGRGFNEIPDKWDALAPYKYSIAIENSRVNGYFTEKLTECYLAHTFPIYYGAPDIEDYFDRKSFLSIDIDDYKQSIELIEKLLEEDQWQKREEILIVEKIRYLENYHIFAAISKLLKGLPDTIQEKTRNVIRSHETFYQYYNIRKIWSSYKHIFYK